MRPRWTETTKRMVTVVGVILGLVLLYLARETLVSLLVAALIAYALYPIVGWLHRRLRFPHTLATVTVYVLLIALLASIPILFGPLLVRQARALDVNLITLLSESREWLRNTLEYWRTVQLLGASLDLSSLVDPALDALGTTGTPPTLPPPETWFPRLFGAVTGFASTVTSATVAFVLTLVYSFYLVKDTPKWGERLDQLVAAPYRQEFSQLRHRLSEIWSSFFRGQLVLCLAIGGMTWVALTVLGIPGSVPLALLAGLLEVIPNLGPLLALIPAALVTLIQGSNWIPLPHGWMTLLVVGAYILIQQVENNFLVPRIIGESVDLPPLIVLIGVIVGASNFGLIGAFLAAPVLASLKVLLLYAYNKVLDRPPFPEENEEETEEEVVPGDARASAPPSPDAPPAEEVVTEDRSRSDDLSVQAGTSGDAPSP